MDIKVTLHQAAGLPESPVEITARGSVGMGNDHSHYVIEGIDMYEHPHEFDSMIGDHEQLDILFQNGPIPEVGHNGVTIEHLLAVCGHRLTELQTGPFASDYNARALTAITEAIAALNQRTLDRIARQVEGKYEK